MIRPLFKYGQSITGKNELIAEPEILCNITEKYINEMMVITDSESITEIEVKELLNDNIAIMMFAEWLLNNKIMPFFLSLLALLQK
jgi:hypothetical protein